jgi:uncharacterized Zn finger protein
MVTKVQMQNWQCRVPKCSSVGKFTVTSETAKSYWTKCKSCGTVNLFDKD